MLKIGVIGYGGRTGDLIKDVLLELKLDVEIVAFTDLDEAAARARMSHPRFASRNHSVLQNRAGDAGQRGAGRMHDRHAVQYAYLLCRGGAAPEYPAVSRKAGIGHYGAAAGPGRCWKSDRGPDGGFLSAARVAAGTQGQGHYRQRGDRRSAARAGV